MKLNWKFEPQKDLPMIGRPGLGKVHAVKHESGWKVFVTTVDGRVFCRENTKGTGIKSEISAMQALMNIGYFKARSTFDRIFKVSYRECRINRNFNSYYLADISESGKDLFPGGGLRG